MPLLTVPIFDNFVLDNPFWIASADLSHTIGGLKKLSAYQPAAITLKTTAPKRRSQPGTTEQKYTRAVHVHQDPFLRHRRGEILSTFYCDGPPKEYLSIKATEQLLKEGRQLFPSTKIGISIFMDEDYARIANKLLEFSDFAELNLKYAARPQGSSAAGAAFFGQQQHATDHILAEVAAFCEVFADRPMFIKITRELSWLRPCRELKALAAVIHREREKGRQLGVVIANTRKTKISADLTANYHKGEFPGDLSGGIVAGEYLYIETYNLVQSISSEPALAGVPIIATGGITTISNLVELIHAGAKAVQIYSALIAYSVSYYEELRDSLATLLQRSNLDSYTDLIHVMRTMGARDEWRKIRFHALDIPIKKSTSLKADIDSHREQWLKEIAEGLCAQISRNYDDRDIGNRVAKLQNPFAIAQDLGLPSLNCPLPEDLGGEPEDVDVHITVTRASFGGHMLAYLMSSQSKRYIEDIAASTGQLLRTLKDGPWDLAAITEAYVEEVSTNQVKGGSQPVILGRLLTSEYRLYHFVESLSEVDEIFHFGGREATWTLRNFEARGELHHIEEKSAIKTDQLINWLRHPAGSKASFLAKDPLASAYVSLARGAEVHVGWREKIDLYLLGSRRFCEHEGPQGLQQIYRDISRSRRMADMLLPGRELSKVLESEIRVTWGPYLSI